MSTNYSSSFNPGITETQFTGQGGDQVISPETQEPTAPKAPGVVFDNLTFDPTVINSLQKSYSDSFVSIQPPDSLMPQNQQTYISDLATIGKATQDMVSQDTQSSNNPIEAQSVLSEIQTALEAAQEIYDRYYAPGAPFADLVQGYRFPTQEVSNSMMTVQHVAGLALVQTAATPGSEEQLLSNGPTPGQGLTVAEANYAAAKSFLSLLRTSHSHQKHNSLGALRKVLTELNVLRVHNAITRRQVDINKNINHGPLNVLEAKTEEKNNAARNLAAQLGNKAASFLNKLTYAAQGLVAKASPAQITPADTELFAEDQVNIENKNISNNNDVTKNATPHLSATSISESNLSNQPFSYHITGNTAAAVDTNTALSLDHGEVVESAATNIINISPSAMTEHLNNSLQQSVDRLNKLVEGRPQNALNVSLR
jgi:hypothetical protein